MFVIEVGTYPMSEKIIPMLVFVRRSSFLSFLSSRACGGFSSVFVLFLFIIIFWVLEEEDSPSPHVYMTGCMYRVRCSHTSIVCASYVLSTSGSVFSFYLFLF